MLHASMLPRNGHSCAERRFTNKCNGRSGTMPGGRSVPAPTAEYLPPEMLAEAPRRHVFHVARSNGSWPDVFPIALHQLCSPSLFVNLKSTAHHERACYSIKFISPSCCHFPNAGGTPVSEATPRWQAAQARPQAQGSVLRNAQQAEAAVGPSSLQRSKSGTNWGPYLLHS